MLDGADGTHHGVELQIFGHLVLAADAGGVYQVEVESELVVSRVDAVAGCSGNLRHDVAVFADKCVDDAALSGVWSSHHGKAWYAFFEQFAAVVFQLRHHVVEQVSRAASCSRADTHRVAESELVELCRIVYQVVVVCLVCHENHRQLRAAQNLCHVHVPVCHSRSDVHEEED